MRLKGGACMVAHSPHPSAWLHVLTVAPPPIPNLISKIRRDLLTPVPLNVRSSTHVPFQMLLTWKPRHSHDLAIYAQVALSKQFMSQDLYRVKMSSNTTGVRSVLFWRSGYFGARTSAAAQVL